MRLAALLTALLSSVCLVTPARAGDPDDPPRFVFGRTPEVFQPDADVVATRISGWLDASYENNDVSGENPSLNLNHLNLSIDSRYGEHWQLFFEGEFEKESGLDGYEDESEWEVEQAYVSYAASDRLRARVGQFNTPFGYWKPIHWSILMDTISPPIMEGNAYVPEQQIGVELSGHIFSKLAGSDTELRYSAFAGYGNHTSLLDSPETQGLSYGSDLRLLLDERYMLGVSLYAQERRIEPHDRNERSVMLYGEVDLPGRLTLRSEFMRQRRDRHAHPKFARNIGAGYVKLRWDLRDSLYLNYRYGFGDDDSGGSTEKAHIHTTTLGFRPHKDVRLKLEWSSHRFKGSNRDNFNYWAASVGFLF